MNGWTLLEQELDAWLAAGRTATLWLRDDDARRDSAALRRLLAISENHDVPVAVAAIPADVEASLGEAIARFDNATLVQHGYAHRNHAPNGERSSELGPQRAVASRLDELLLGRERLAGAFGRRFAPILVPPWNRIGEDLLPCLAPNGYCAVSCFGPRAASSPAPGLLQLNAHVDPIAWRRGRGFIGTEGVSERIAAHLGARRSGACDPDEPTGFLAHHLVFDDDMWECVDAFLARTANHRAVRWLGVEQACGAQPVIHFLPICMNRV